MIRTPILLAALVAGTAHAWAPLDTCGADYTHWTGTTSWQLHRTGASPYYSQLSDGEVYDAMYAGFQVWSDATCCSDFRHTYGGDTATGYSTNDNANVIEFLETAWPGAFGSVNSTIAVTLPQYSWNDCILDNGDQAYNAVGFAFTTTNNPGWNDTDLQSITAHEHGHWLGLDHSNTNTATMYASYPGGTTSRTLHADDEAGVCAIYPGTCGPTCEMTEVIACDDTDAGTTTGASNTVQTWDCANWETTGPEVVYEFTSSITGDVRVQLSNLSDDLDLFVTEDAAGACDNQSCWASGTAYSADEEVVFPAVSGATYAIVVDGWDGATSAFTLATDCGGAGGPGTGTGGPAGSCASTQTLACGAFANGTNIGGPRDVDAFSCANWETSGPEKVYQFTAPATGDVTVHMGGLNADLDLFVTTAVGGACDESGCIGVSGNPDDNDELIVFSAVAGTTYAIVADGWDGASSSFTLDLTCANPGAGTTTGTAGSGGTGSGTGGSAGTGTGGSGTGGSTNGATGTGTGGDGGTSTGTGTGDAAVPESELPKGCGCASGGELPAYLALFPMALIGLSRRGYSSR